ncbi:MAG TPA: cysteine desulfurase family protein [Bacillota bacterium]|nr:cysteine desulfurase family protein [Bacillota bacterium]
MRTIYLDHAATTPIHPEVLQTMLTKGQDVFGNPSSIHSFGRETRKHLDEARRTVANSLGAKEQEIIFTSGGTESNNLALIGTALANKHKGKHIISTNQEHYATLDSLQYLESLGFTVSYIPVNEYGQVSVKDIELALTEETILVSVMAVNNETGVIQPIDEIAKGLKDKNILFHIDAVQAYGYIDIAVDEMNIDLLTVSSHKINGPKGVGALYIRDGVQLQSLLYGGEQERKRRPGTESVINIIGFQKAVEIMQQEKMKRNKLYEEYKTLFLQTLRDEKVEYYINGPLDKTVPTIVNLSFPSCEVETLLTNLDLEGIAASSGSACTAGSVEYSHVLLAMFGDNSERPKNSIRFSFGSHNTKESVVEAAKRIAKIIKRLKAL